MFLVILMEPIQLPKKSDEDLFLGHGRDDMREEILHIHLDVVVEHFLGITQVLGMQDRTGEFLLPIRSLVDPIQYRPESSLHVDFADARMERHEPEAGGDTRTTCSCLNRRVGYPYYGLGYPYYGLGYPYYGLGYPYYGI